MGTVVLGTGNQKSKQCQTPVEQKGKGCRKEEAHQAYPRRPHRPPSREFLFILLQREK
jgi:hypothetical protein